MKLFLRGRNGGLYPTDRYSADRMAKYQGRDVACDEPKTPRNLAHHQKYWVLVNFCAEHSAYTPEQVHDIFKLRTGLTTMSQLTDGTIVQHPGSIAWAKMDQTAFSEFYDRVVQVVITDILPGVTVKQVEQELRELVG